MKLIERNRNILEKVILNSDGIEKGRPLSGKAFRESFKTSWGVDPYAKELREEGFSYRKCAEKMAEHAKLREAEQSTAWTQLLRAGIQNIANNMYMQYPTTWEDWVTVVPSSKDTELYAPLQSVTFPNEVAQGGLFPEVSTAGLNLKLENKKFGSLFAVTQELLDDDQTGQMQQRASQMGEYLKILAEVLVMSKFVSPSGGVDYLNFHVSTSETKPADESNYPWAAASAPFVGGGFNRPASYGVISQANIQSGLQALMTQKDLLGNYMAVNPTHIIHGAKRRFDVAILLNSSYYPAGAQAAGTTGGAFAINPIQSVLQPIVCRYLPKNTGVIDGQAETWALVDASKPAFIMQQRTGIEVVAEAPNSGEGFARQVQRFRASMRCNADFIDPRFYWLGNDGSAT